MLHPISPRKNQALLDKLEVMAQLEKMAAVEGLAHLAFLLPKMRLAREITPKPGIP